MSLQTEKKTLKGTGQSLKISKRVKIIIFFVSALLYPVSCMSWPDFMKQQMSMYEHTGIIIKSLGCASYTEA